MLSLTVIFGLLALGGAIVIYGTLVKNGWGINPCGVSCPGCGAALPQVRRPQSIRQVMWGGWVCPNCGVQADKWGREIRCKDAPGRKVPESSLTMGEADQRGERALFERFKGRSRGFWVFVVVMILLDIAYDVFFPRAVVFDVIAAIALYVWYRKADRANS